MNFRKALFISFVSHFFILAPLGNIGVIFPNKTTNEPQVTYYKPAPIKAETRKEIKTKKDAEAAESIRISSEQKSAPPADLHKRQKVQTPNPPERQEIPPLKKENIIPESIPGTTLPNTPECVSYYQYIREEIRRFLKGNYTAAYEEGDVYISFALNQGGELVGIEIIDKKSSGDPQLRRLSYESIKNNTPFKPFPKGLSQNQISFSLPIVFKHR